MQLTFCSSRPALIVLLFFESFLFGKAYANETLCEKSEAIHFSCLVANSKKVISVCGSPALSEDEGYLQYRFGRPGAVELVYPKTKEKTQQQFYWEENNNYQSGSKTLYFEIGSYSYAVFSFEIGEVLSGKSDGEKKYGVWVGRLGVNAPPYETLCASVPDGVFNLGSVVTGPAPGSGVKK